MPGEMETFHELLVTLARLLSTVVVIILFFMFIVRPLLDYFITSREIEQRKKLHDDFGDEDDGPPLDLSVGRADAGGGDNSPAEEFTVPQSKPKASDMEALSRLAASDPDKASDLVKQWVNSDSPRSR